MLGKRKINTKVRNDTLISQGEFDNSQVNIKLTIFVEFSEKLPRIVTEKTFLSKKSIKENSKYC